MRLSILKPKEYTDRQIVEGIQEHDSAMEKYFFKKCERYFNQNYSSVFVMEQSLKDDIFQECFVKLWTDIESFRIHIGEDGTVWRNDRSGADKPMTSQLHTFLMDIAKNVYRVWQRNEKEDLLDDVFPCSGNSQDEEHSFFDKVSTKDSAWDNTENVVTGESEYFEQALSDNDQRGLLQEIVQVAIMNLSETCRDILTMFYYEDLSLDEILLRRGENSSKDGLKTGKYKCMKRFETDVREMFAKHHVRY